MELQLNH